MIKNYLNFFVFILLLNCNPSKEKKETNQTKVETKDIPVLNLQEANRLAKLPLNCMETEYPNRLGQTLGSNEDLLSPKELHPAFYGCFDWHSAVHGHWSLVRLLKEFPELENADEIKKKLQLNLSSENILKEIAYFDGEHNKTYERTYGWGLVTKTGRRVAYMG